MALLLVIEQLTRVASGLMHPLNPTFYEHRPPGAAEVEHARVRHHRPQRAALHLPVHPDGEPVPGNGVVQKQQRNRGSIDHPHHLQNIVWDLPGRHYRMYPQT